MVVSNSDIIPLKRANHLAFDRFCCDFFLKYILKIVIFARRCVYPDKYLPNTVLLYFVQHCDTIY